MKKKLSGLTKKITLASLLICCFIAVKAEESNVYYASKFGIRSDGVTTNTRSIQKAIDWISENSTRSTSTHTYRFDVAPSEEYNQRTAEIKFINKENNLAEIVKVTQTQKDALVIANENYTVSKLFGEKIERIIFGAFGVRIEKLSFSSLSYSFIRILNSPSFAKSVVGLAP